MVTTCICEPVMEKNCPAHNRRKSLWRSAAKEERRAGGSASSAAVGVELSGVLKCKTTPRTEVENEFVRRVSEPSVSEKFRRSQQAIRATQHPRKPLSPYR